MDFAMLEGAESRPDGSPPTALPPFLASMGEEIHMGPRFTDREMVQDDTGPFDVEA